jgi:hypothetical protein
MRWVTNLSPSSKKQGDWIILFSSCILVTLKFAAGQQVCRPSRAKLGLKDWASLCLKNWAKDLRPVKLAHFFLFWTAALAERSGL